MGDTAAKDKRAYIIERIVSIGRSQFVAVLVYLSVFRDVGKVPWYQVKGRGAKAEGIWVRAERISYSSSEVGRQQCKPAQ